VSESNDRAKIAKQKFLDSIHDIAGRHDLEVLISPQTSYFSFTEAWAYIPPPPMVQQLMNILGSPQAMVGSPQAMVGSPQAMVGSPQAMVGSPQAMVGSPQAMVMIGTPFTMPPPGQVKYQQQPMYAQPSDEIYRGPMMPPGFAQPPVGYSHQPQNGMHEAPPIETYDPTNVNDAWK
jgi:hypothetical protein